MRRLAVRLSRIFAERFDKSPIADVAAMTRFVRTRAAYIAQTSLYGYLKTRMGTSFRRHFEDEAFSVVIRDSAVRLFVSCLADLTIFAVATTGRDGGLTADEAGALARRCFRDALAAVAEEADWAVPPAGAVDRFVARTDATIWPSAAIGATAFAGSAADLIRFAPVVDEFKELDEKMVTNSIRFRWRDVRERFRRRVDGAAIAEDWRRMRGLEPPSPGGLESRRRALREARQDRRRSG